MSSPLALPAWGYMGFAALHVLLGHFGAALVHRVRFGRSPLVLYRAPRDSAHARITRRISVVSAAWAALLAIGFAVPGASSAWLQPVVLVPEAIGWALAVVGLVSMLFAQYAMGQGFRVGQHGADAPDALAQSAWLRRSRNPIYLSSWGALLGISLWWPSAPLLALLILLGYTLHQLVLAEEAFLLSRYGDAYRVYCASTPRYLGFRRAGELP